MTAELPADSFERLRPLLPQPCLHLVVESILAAATPARVFVDDAARPRAALVWCRNHFFLAGDPDIQKFNQDLHDLFTGIIYPQRQAAGGVRLELCPLNAGDFTQAAAILEGKDPQTDRREYYTFEAFKQDWQSMIPEGMALLPVDQALLDRKELEHLDNLAEELVSERPTVADFLEKSFGVALLDQGAPHTPALAGWCLSEYNLPGKSGRSARCEVGIETVEGYRKRGLATLLGSGLVAEAKRRDIHQVGWHCFAWNTASSATARKIGFTLAADYPIYYAWYQSSFSLAVQGNINLGQGLYDVELERFEKSLANEDAPAWANWGAACACARLERMDDAMHHLGRTIARGFINLSLFESSQHMVGLRGTPAWDVLMTRLKE